MIDSKSTDHWSLIELVYKDGLVHFSGSHERLDNGTPVWVFSFRNSAGEPFQIEVLQDKIPFALISAQDASALEQGLQAILDSAGEQPSVTI